MLAWEKKIPEYLLKKDAISRTTIFTGIFALAFINFYSPFGAESWLNLSQLELFLDSSLAILTGMVVIVLSRIIMYHSTKKNSISYLYYSLWIAIEIISMAVGYSVYVKYVLHDPRLFYIIVQVTIKNTALVLLLPYSVLWLYFAYKEKTNLLEKFSSNHNESPQPVADKMIPFYDDKGKLKFSVINEDLIYLEASDNYVSIHYSANNKVAKYMIRNTLKNLEERLKPLGFIRCHRSYLVNFSKVKILKREKDGVFLELNTNNELTLPVSKTYVATIVESFSESSI